MGLFGFGKKNAAPKKTQESAPQLNPAEVLIQVESLRADARGLKGKALADALVEIGKRLDSIGELDQAIEAYEQSLEANHVMGKASTALVKLYNKKRAAAAADKDDEAIKYYMDKVNEMLALSKDQLRGRA